MIHLILNRKQAIIIKTNKAWQQDIDKYSCMTTKKVLYRFFILFSYNSKKNSMPIYKTISNLSVYNGAWILVYLVCVYKYKDFKKFFYKI